MRLTVRVPGRSVLFLAAAVSLAAASAALADTGPYRLRKLVSDVPGAAEQTDPNLVNAWGIAFNPFGFDWVANNGTGVSTLYDGNGNKNSLVVTIPGGKPTGIVYNGSNTDFIVNANGKSGPARFLFATENGTIAAWAPAVDPNNAITVVPNTTGAIYKGITIGSDGSRFLLYAADFHNNRIDVFDSAFARTPTAGGFTDSNVPDTYGPFNVQNIGGAIYVAYAKADKDRVDEVAGRGNGIIDIYDARGNLVRRFLKGGPLNAPWGMAIAPADFGALAGRLLVGNFGDGTINAFDVVAAKTIGALSDSNGDPIVIPGLWGIGFGNGLLNQPTNTLFFAAGPDDENHGLYGRIDVNR